jgi:uncharacterized oxidoreductase
MKVDGNTVLITGGATGIGPGLAEAFHRLGNEVIIAGRRVDRLNETASANPGMHVRALDVADPHQVVAVATELQAEFPDLNVLVNNAGINKAENLKSLSDASIAEEIVSVDFLGPIRLTTALVPALLMQPSATVMTLSSGLAFVPMTLTPTYCATKAAIHSWSQSLRFQLRDTAVDVLELVPPFVQTELFAASVATDPRAMPLHDFVDQVMELLADPPPSSEILVPNVKPLRFAERDGTFEERFTDINSMQW